MAGVPQGGGIQRVYETWRWRDHQINFRVEGECVALSIYYSKDFFLILFLFLVVTTMAVAVAVVLVVVKSSCVPDVTFVVSPLYGVRVSPRTW